MTVVGIETSWVLTSCILVRTYLGKKWWFRPWREYQHVVIWNSAMHLADYAMSLKKSFYLKFGIVYFLVYLKLVCKLSALFAGLYNTKFQSNLIRSSGRDYRKQLLHLLLRYILPTVTNVVGDYPLLGYKKYKLEISKTGKQISPFFSKLTYRIWHIDNANENKIRQSIEPQTGIT